MSSLNTLSNPARGNYVNLMPDEFGNLLLMLTPLGTEATADFLAARAKLGTRTVLAMLLEDHFERGWELVAPDEIGAETDAPILSCGVEYDDRGDIRGIEHLYWFPDFAKRDEVVELLTAGEVRFEPYPRPEQAGDSSRIR